MAVPGLNATHRWNDELTLNDRSVWPHYEIRRLPGFHTLPEAPDLRDVPVGRPLRETPRTSIRASKSIVYEGLIRGRTQAELDAAREALLNAFYDTAEGEMLLTPFGGGTAFVYTARVTALDPPEEYPTSVHRRSLGYERSFTLGLRMSDPRFYEQTEQSEDASPLDTPTDGVPFPAVFPVAFETAEGVAGAVTIDAGAAVTDRLALTLVGPVSDPQVVSATQDRTIAITGLSLNTGQELEIDFYDRTVLLDGQDARAFLDSDLTDWWDRGIHALVPGENTLYLRGGSAAPAAGMTVRWRKARLG